MERRMFRLEGVIGKWDLTYYVVYPCCLQMLVQIWTTLNSSLRIQ